MRRSYKVRILSLYVLVLSVFSLPAQQADKKKTLPDISAFHWNTRVIPLTFDSGAKPTGVKISAIASGYSCDDSGAVYIRQNTPGDPLKVPVVRVSASQSPVTFDVPPSEFKDLDWYVFAYAVDPGGSVFELVEVTTGTPSTYLLTFDKDGQFRRKTRLAAHFLPNGLLALPDGNFLATGLLEEHTGRPQKPITVIFNSDGAVVRRLFDSSSSQNRESRVLELGHVRLGDDQNLYVLRSGDPARVDIYAQTGVLLRSLKLQPPFERAQAYGLFTSAYRVIVEYGRETTKDETPDGRVFLAVYHAETGELLNTYSQMSKGIIACIQNGSNRTQTE